MPIIIITLLAILVLALLSSRYFVISTFSLIIAICRGVSP